MKDHDDFNLEESYREDLRREDRAAKARANWRCQNQPCDGTCPDCRDHAAAAADAEADR